MGAIIRILLISNVEGETDELVGSLEFEGATVVSKDVSGNAKSLAKSIATLFADGKYDFVIAVSDNTVGTNVALNKYEGITASICHDPEEAKSAREEGVNVAVVSQGNIGQVDAIVSAFSKGNGLRLLNIYYPKRVFYPAGQPGPFRELWLFTLPSNLYNLFRLRFFLHCNWAFTLMHSRLLFNILPWLQLLDCRHLYL